MLIGDASHPMTPNLGQGTCQAIEDAVLLSRMLAERGSTDVAFRRFERLRRARVAAIVLGARWIGRFAQSEGRAARLARSGLPHALLSKAIEGSFHAIHDYRAGS